MKIFLKVEINMEIDNLNSKLRLPKLIFAQGDYAVNLEQDI